ncbi:hypothetical protein G9A89_008904 [Geosiphon pyriformis]|nr:hypothetical protein G9A89_008904 [Geosiphon pyriformis]
MARNCHQWVHAVVTIRNTTLQQSSTVVHAYSNALEPIELDWDPEPVINFLNLEQFHKHYQELAPTRKKQEQHLGEINTRLCYHCLIPCNFQYCDECDLIYNPPPRMIYTIPKEEEPINSCISESELVYNPNSNLDNDNDENTSSSSAQYGNENINDSDFDPNYEQYIALLDLSKEQELK